MALNFWKWLAGGKARSPTTVEITCRDLLAAAQEFQLRDTCFWICANMIANAVGRCEFRTFRDGKEVREREHYLWNVEPNVNQNSTAFLHKLVAKLLVDNEVLVIGTRQREGYDALVVADSYMTGGSYPSKQNEYTNVRVGDVSTGLHAFCNDCICAAFLHQTCLCNRSDNRNHFNAGFLPHTHVFARNTGAGRYNLDAFFHNYLCHIVRMRAHQHDIDAKRLLCQLSRLADLLADNLTRCIGAAN